MRLPAVVSLILVVGAVRAFAQAPAPVQHPYGFDPYKPSDLALLRSYGATLVAQTPLSELRKLDPYVPSHAALLRQLGSAMPLWGVTGYPWYLPLSLPASLTPFPESAVESMPAARITALLDELIRARAAAAAVSPAPGASPPGPTAVATVMAPESNDGVWISYAGQRWISAGPAVPFDDAAFVRIGQYAGFPVFRRAGATEDVIYVPAREDLIEPYRLKQ
jgi:hypothetical protein